MSVQLLQQLVAIHTVDLAGFLDALAAGGGAAQAVHPDLHEVGSGALVHIQNVADDGLTGDLLHSLGFVGADEALVRSLDRLR